MIPQLGNFAIILALCFALIQCIAPLYGYAKQQRLYFQLSRTAAIGQFIFLAFSLVSLILCFLNNDMSVFYVQQHSHRLLPLLYRIGAAWGGHEGSLLLWCVILSGWTFVFILLSSLGNSFSISVLPPTQAIHDKIIIILGLISSGFIIFLFFTSNPFIRIFPLNGIIGEDLTPVLQDPGLIFHPPMLYLGYVGFSIGFAFAVAALWEGKIEKTWAKACKPWIILPWSFLSCGIVLGSWWAYRELGWGGWWFWDPVENASLLPWLAATALLHCLIVGEKRQVFYGWTLLLAIITFALSLIGTFLVRSGVLVSVHAFANDPTRGLFLLLYLAFLIGGALMLYGCRIHRFYQPPHFQLFSRETFLLINSVILLTAVVTILIGTLYPIILDALNLEKISVGEPYFNTVFVPIMLLLLLLMGAAPHVPWRTAHVHIFWNKIRTVFLISLFITFLMPFAYSKLFEFEYHPLAGIGIGISTWIILSTLKYAYQRWHSQSLPFLPASAMIVAHIGIAMTVLGITINQSYAQERQMKMSIGETVSLAGYTFTFMQLSKSSHANFETLLATFAVKKAHHSPTSLIAEQRIYRSHDQRFSKPGILTNGWRDLYLALGTSLPDGAWTVRIYYKPLVRWIWAGGFLLLISGFLSLMNYRHKQNNYHEH